MNKNQFVEQLKVALSRLPLEEQEEILFDIREYFTEGHQDGKTEEEIAHSLGSPIEIANELLEAYSIKNNSPQIIQQSIANQDELLTITEPSFSNIKINIQQGALIVRPSKSDITTVKLLGENEKLKLTADVNGDTLYIDLKSTRHWFSIFSLFTQSITVEVLVPKKVYESIYMETDNGRVDAKKIFGKKVTAQSDNGRIVLKEIASTYLNAETDNGRIVLDKIQSDSVKTRTDNGRIEIENIDAEDIDAISKNGRISLQHVTGNIIGKTDNGRITLEHINLNRNMDIKTNNGSISLEGINEPTDVSIYAKTGNGKIDIFGESNSKTVFGDGTHSIGLQTNNGRITVK